VIKKIFQLLTKKSGTKSGSSDNDGLKDLEHFVDYVVRALVDQPDDVNVETVPGERATIIQVKCAKDDIGKIIGKNGKTISAIRALVNGAGKRFEQEFTVEVLD
jgi:uncharacterized protein